MIHGVSIRVARTNRAINATSTPHEEQWDRQRALPRDGLEPRGGNSLFSSGVSVAKAYLSSALGDVPELRIVLVDAHFLGCPRDLAELESRTTSLPPPSSRAAT